MLPDSEMKIDYAAVLKQLRAELEGLDDRRQALLASVAAIQRLVEADDQPDAFPDGTAPAGRIPSYADTIKMPVIPPGAFTGKSPTDAYRELMRVWPGHYRPPQIADLFIQGGMNAPSRTTLVQAIHSVLKRERSRTSRANGA